MSGLEKFQASKAWRTNVKKFLFMERKPEVYQKTSTISESQRYSLDIGEDLKNIIENKKKNKKTVRINLNEEIINFSNTRKEKDQQETIDSIAEIQEEDNMNRSVYNCNDTECNELSMWRKTSDESFEALERMCDKTASDPNSTLFQYLHDDRKEEILAEVKKRSTDGKTPHVNENGNFTLNNCTLLDEIEAPSRMWENTICGDTILQTSPIKMAGLHRPSTIIEEAPDDSSNSVVSSQMSFQTATKSVSSDASSSAYDTAHDSTVASNRTVSSNKRQQELKMIDVDNISMLTLKKSTQLQEDNAAPIISIEITDATITEEALLSNDSCDEKNTTDINNVSVDLIDFEKTFGPLQKSPHSSLLEQSITGDVAVEDVENKLKENEHKIDSYNLLDDSVIEILSDDDENDVVDVKDDLTDNMEQIQLTDIKSEVKLKSQLRFNHDTYSFNESLENDKENFGEVNGPFEKNMEFNDTMEEVEYMLKRGMEYMAAEAATKHSTEKVIKANSSCKVQISKTRHNSPRKPYAHASTSVTKVKSFTYISPAKKTPSFKCDNSSSKRYNVDMKPFPKLDLFAKSPTHPRHKELMNKQQKFSHVVSPIGTYMKKTPKIPLMSSINCKQTNYLNSTAILELENESRLYQPKFSTDTYGNKTSGLFNLPASRKPLPKKAYISSDLKSIVDERTPVTIPGGKKIQKYLENAMMPAVLRHDGKFKIPGATNSKLSTSMSYSLSSPSKQPLNASSTNSSDGAKRSQIQHRKNTSLADLSLMAGDVSLYTIMDAQKF